ncbi:MAG: hypothetical protein DWQ02_12625 [Bacteroidetes bacterium]|nr:MAG: hypothetical protein DWQ02_12625 [Bacteroidota bacterium]
MRTYFSTIFLLFFISISCFAQTTPNTRVVVINDSTRLIKASVFIDEPEVKYLQNVSYLSFHKNRLFETQAAHVGHLLHGTFEVFSKDDILIEQGEVESGLKNGKWKHWHLNGKLSKMVNWKKSILEGKFTEYDLEGKVSKKGQFKDGHLHGKIKYYEKGEFVNSEDYKGGELQEKIDKKKPDTENAVVKKEDQGDEKQVALTKEKKRSKPNREQLSGEEIVEEDLSKNIAIYLDSKESGEVIKNANLKISAFNRMLNEYQYLFFARTDEEGKYVLKRDTGDYVLFISHPGFTPKEVRIFGNDKRKALNISLEKYVSCNLIKGQIEKGSYSVPINNATVEIKEKNGRKVASVFSNRSGYFEHCLPCGKSYDITVVKDGFESKTDQIHLTENCETQNQAALTFYLKEKGKTNAKVIAASKEETVPEKAPLIQKTDKEKKSIPVAEVIETDGITFYVIAGTFSSKSNAKKRLDKVRGLGYKEAQIIHHPDSGYFAVCLGMFDNKSGAQKLADRAKSADEIKTYIKQL